MSRPQRRFRIEGAADPIERAPPLPPGPPLSDPRRSDGAARPETEAAPPLRPHETLSSDLLAMRDAITTTKRELFDLRRAPAGTLGMNRAAGELDAVSAATEQATTTILGAVEEIELSANILRGAGTEAARGAQIEMILDRVLVLYEACNFHDITGQRLRKVVTTLRFVEERLNRVIDAWDVPGSQARPTDPAQRLVSGPSLPGDSGHVSQADVDRYFI